MDKSGERLKEYLSIKRIGQVDVAQAINVSAAYINMLCMGRKPVGKKTAIKLQEAIGISSGWLLTGEGSMYADCKEREKKECDEEKKLEEQLNVIKIYTKIIEDVQTLNKQLTNEVAEVVRLKNELIEAISQLKKA